jgi:hypothetical protein
VASHRAVQERGRAGLQMVELWRRRRAAGTWTRVLRPRAGELTQREIGRELYRSACTGSRSTPARQAANRRSD